MPNCRECLHDEMCFSTHTGDSPACCDYLDAARYHEIMQAEREGRLVILPCGENAELKMDEKTYKGDHWNHSLTAFRDDPTTPSGKQVTLFSIEAAEKALEEAK